MGACHSGGANLGVFDRCKKGKRSYPMAHCASPSFALWRGLETVLSHVGPDSLSMFSGSHSPDRHTPDFAQMLNNNKVSCISMCSTSRAPICIYQPRPGIILGSTNPIVLSAARHYPHILRVSPPLRSDEPVQGVFGTLSRTTATGSSFKDAQSSSHGVFSQRKRHVKKDTVALKLAEERVRAGDCAITPDHFRP